MPRPNSRSAPPREVRIIGGQWKRTKLPVSDQPGLRPTLDRVRETLFNWLGQDLSGWRCLDAFAGTGALGFEAASRGAAEVILLERDVRLTRQMAATQARLSATMLRIETVDALAWMKRSAPERFDLVFLDPPFSAGLFEAALAEATRLVVPGGALYLESNQPCDEAGLADRGWRLHRQGHAGAVHFHLLLRG